jgi:hypothetical protein
MSVQNCKLNSNVKYFNVSIISDWQEPETIIDHNVDHWYIDGSGIQICFGTGIYMDPYMTIGKAYLWEAFPRYFLLK